MPTAEEFDEFYVSTRRRLVLQTFAVTGDLGASRTAVRDAYVAAKHHWNKVGRVPDPEEWVRPRAWAIAQRRHSARPWRKEKSLTAEQTALLEALHQLTDVQRKTLVLNHLAAVPMSTIGREIGETQQRAEVHLQAATAAVSVALDCDSTSLRARLEDLGAASDTVKLPRPPVIRRSGLRRRRNHAIAGSALAVLVTIGAGALVLPDDATDGTIGAAAPRPPLTKKMLLTAAQAAPLAPGGSWRVDATHDNTSGTGLNTMCQTARFADTDGMGAWVRTFTSAPAGHDLVQTAEVSSSPGDAVKAFETTLGWYAECSVARIQLVDAVAVTGVGDQAQVLRMRIPGKQPRSFVVGIARTGALTNSVVLETGTRKPARTNPLVSVLATSIQNLCDSPVAGACVSTVSTRAALPPRTGEAAGFLAIADLPAIANVTRPWAGTDPVPATVNGAATTCDEADFAKAGAVEPVTRTYLIPEAGLPRRFGLTETIGEFGTPRAARKFVDRIAERMRTCPDRELASTVSREVVQLGGRAPYALWRLENQVNQAEDKVPFWMGVARDGRWVAQVNLTPVGEYDVDQGTFRDLVVRARDRLQEVSR